MSVTTTARFTVYGDIYEDLVTTAEERISEFFEINASDVKKKFNYELLVEENSNMESEHSYSAQVIVRSRDV